MSMKEYKIGKLFSPPRKTKTGQKSLWKLLAINGKTIYEKLPKNWTKSIFFQEPGLIPLPGWCWPCRVGTSLHGKCCHDLWQKFKAWGEGRCQWSRIFHKKYTEKAFSSAVFEFSPNWGYQWTCHLIYRENTGMKEHYKTEIFINS